MGAKVVVELDNRPDGSDVRIPGLGVFKNGGTYEIDDKVWARFRANNPEYDENHTFKYSTAEYERRAKEQSGEEEAPPPPPPPPPPPASNTFTSSSSSVASEDSEGDEV